MGVHGVRTPFIRTLAVSAVGVAGSVFLAAHTQPAPAARSAAARTANGYAAPRTPWGDPDLQGNYTNVYESGTPLEPPDEFAGRKLEDVKGGELAALKRQIQQRTIERFQTSLFFVS
jgi:hypothetical protein